MNQTINRILEYLRLFRFQTSAATATAPLISALVNGQRNIFLLFILLMIGILYHIYGFVLNEYIDIEVDRKSLDLYKKPLVSGSIPKNYAKSVIIISWVSACALAILFFPKPLPILFLLLSIIFGGIYDIFGKKILGSDFILGAGFFFLCLFGTSTYSNNFTIITLVICFLYFFHIIFNNAIEGGLKDVYHDRLSGVKTTATRLGVRLKGGKPLVTKGFLVFAYVLTIIFISLIFFLIYNQDRNLWLDRYMYHIIILGLLSLILFVTLYKFLHMLKFNRSRLKRLFSAHEITSYLMLLIALSPMLGQEITASLFLIPSSCYIFSNIILYKTILQPLV